jgi:hypothetical protein
MKDFHAFINEGDDALKRKWNPAGLATFPTKTSSPEETIRAAEQKVARLQAQIRAAERKNDSRRALLLKTKLNDAEADLDRLRQRLRPVAETRVDVRRIPNDAAHRYDPKSDPMSVMSPEDRKEAHRLFTIKMKSPSGSRRQREAQEAYAALMRKYNIGTWSNA